MPIRYTPPRLQLSTIGGRAWIRHGVETPHHAPASRRARSEPWDGSLDGARSVQQAGLGL